MEEEGEGRIDRVNPWESVVYPRLSALPYDWFLIGPALFLFFWLYQDIEAWVAASITALLLLGVNLVKSIFDSRCLELALDSERLVLRRVYSRINDIRVSEIPIASIDPESVILDRLSFPPLVWVGFKHFRGKKVRVFFDSDFAAEEFYGKLQDQCSVERSE
ncbi:hypothetical protein IC757_04960 [Wenzhouxiangella sp. AB-CW3]|uniref:hypothetical protein n=1 Tax=Wenzhouxiangella sp. AB-CW3 TaxID=2771012 RepID=UPI00168AA3A1|nr:hypothetical protein [Wenzhouxiangella sp. AB-CW3]QOC23493.1 hypothetical protein IC757_04960 [Wenzhouxiangella sp. AB-CW3]